MSKQFHDAYPGAPASFHQALEQTCRQIESTAPKRRIPARTALVAALIAALLLASIAYAASRSSVLDRLFSGGTPSEEAQRLVTPVTQQVSDQGVALSIDEVVVDGDGWHLGYTVTSELEQPVFYTVAQSTTLDESTSLLDTDVYSVGVLGGTVDGVPMETTKKGVVSFHSFGWNNVLSKGKPFDVTVKLRIGTPAMQLVIYPEKAPDPGDYGSEVKAKEWPVFKAAKQIPVYRAGFSEFAKHLSSANRADALGVMKIAEQAGCLTPLTELMLTATIDPAKAPRQIHARLAQPQRFEFDDRVLEVAQLDLAPTTSHIYFEVIPSQSLVESELSEQAYMQRFAADYAVLSAEGELLLDVRYTTANPQLDKVIRYRSADKPAAQLPEQVTLAPILWEGEGAGRRIAGYDMERSATVRLDRLTKDFRMATKPLPDIQPVIEAFFGADAAVLQPSPGETGTISLASEDHKSSITWREYGFFYLDKPGRADPAMPTALADDERTARAFLADVIQLDTDTLWLTHVDHYDGKRVLWFEYRWDGMSSQDELSDWVHVTLKNGEITEVQGWSQTTQPIG